MKRLFVVVPLVLAVACGGSSSNTDAGGTTVSDPTGQRAFFGAFQLNSTTAGTCGFIVTPSGAATAKCVAGSTTATLSGTMVAALRAPGSAAASTVPGQGRLSLSGTVNGVTWTFQGSIPAPGLPATSRDTLGGLLSAGGITVTVVAADSTVDTVNAYCGTFSGSDTGSWLLQVGGSTASGVVVTSDGGGGTINGTRSGGALALTAYDPTSGAAVVSASGTVSASSASGTWTGLPGSGIGTGTWSGNLCPGSNSFVCCGTGSATQCLFAASCPTTGGAVQGACTFSMGTFNECDQYAGYASVTEAQASCTGTSLNGTWSTTACTSVGRMGTCTTGNGAGGTFSQNYYTGISASLLSSIQANCIRVGGAWTP